VDVAVWSGSLLRWERELTAFKGRLAPVFGRSEVRQSVGNWRSRLGCIDRIGCSHSLGEVVGMQMPLRDLVRGHLLAHARTRSAEGRQGAKSGAFWPGAGSLVCRLRKTPWKSRVRAFVSAPLESVDHPLYRTMRRQALSGAARRLENRSR
jgi:hypothetical protein